MNMKVIEVKDKKDIKRFTDLAARLYDSGNKTEDPGDITKLLEGTHVLSKYFTLKAYLVTDDGNKVRGRFGLTIYDNDDSLYLGYFECENDPEAARAIFDYASEYAKANGFKRVVGPVDSSFWIKYRLKINKFEAPYTGEPYNLDYYLGLFEDNGFKVAEHYVSHRFATVDESYSNPKFTEHYNEFISRGYSIVKPAMEDFDKVIEEVYELISDLYSDFPIYKYISKEDFVAVFSSYKKIINMDMVRMAYYNGKAAGFYISVPNYGNIVYDLTPLNILKILKIRKDPKDYVMLYMGVDPRHTGLGKALCYAIAEELKKSNLPSIGALQKDGKITQKYGEEVVNDVYEYVLLQKEI